MALDILSRLIQLLTQHPDTTAIASDNIDTFGDVLWHILGGQDFDKHLAAGRLGVDAGHLNHILQGRKHVSQQFLANKRWRAVLAKYYPAGWKQRSAAFERCAARLRVRRGACPREPKLKAGFGYVLWLILGGERTNVMKAAELLNIDRTYLSAIIHGRAQTSQTCVNKKGWHRVLSQHYADGWKQYGALFDQHAGALQKRAGASRSEPKDRDSFGYILWLIVSLRRRTPSLPRSFRDAIAA